MSEQPFNLVLAMLRDIRARQDEHTANLQELKEGIGFLEGGYASLSRLVDRIAGDVEPIKRRLELSDTPAT